MKILRMIRGNQLSGFGVLALCAVGSLYRPLIAQETSVPFETETILKSEIGAGAISDIINRVQNAFLKPITYEEYPFETNIEQAFGASITLVPGDTSPYLAAQTINNSYQAAGLLGQYVVAQTGERVDILPAHGPSNATKTWKPLMSYPVTFPLDTRTIEETLTLVTDQIAAQSGYHLILVDSPGPQYISVQLSAQNRAARDLISDLGERLNLTLSFQALYDPGSKTYYLRVISLAPPTVAGGPPVHGYRKQLPTLGPPDSPFFVKEK